MFRKNCVFFRIHCNPLLANIAVRDLQSSQRNANVQSLLLAGNFCTTNCSRMLMRKRWQLSRTLGKKPQYLINKGFSIRTMKILYKFLIFLYATPVELLLNIDSFYMQEYLYMRIFI